MAFKIGDLVRLDVQGGSAFYHAIAGELAEILFIYDKDTVYIRLLSYHDICVTVSKKKLSRVKRDTVEIKLIKELKRELAQLRKELSDLKSSFDATQKSPEEEKPDEVVKSNKIRKQFIDEAKEFVQTHGPSEGFLELPYKNAKGLQRVLVNIQYHVQSELREVTVQIYDKENDTLIGKGLAKCHPKDTFNADIGKAIALGRALSLNISKFKQTPQPSDAAVGMFVSNGIRERRVLKMVPELDYLTYIIGGGRAFKVEDGWLADGQLTILDDTDAEYS